MADDTREKESGAKAERGIQYPGDSLGVALELLSRVREAVGFGSASRETLAEALGYRGITGTSARKIGSLTHFDLLERVGSGAYRISDLGRRILMPTTEEEMREAVAEAAKRPALYASLLERYKDHALPSMLPNLLAREHGVFPRASELAARAFRETMEFAGLLRHGVLYFDPEPVSPSNVVVGRQENGTASSGTPGAVAGDDGALATSIGTPQPQAGGALQTYTVALDKTGRLAVLQIPLPVSARDLRKVGAWINYMIDNVLDEETPAISGN